MDLSVVILSYNTKDLLEQALRTWMSSQGTNPQDYLGIRQKPIEIF